MSNRRGMFLEEGSGEYDTLATLHQLAATDSEEEGEEADYALVDTSSGDDSYHSDNDEIAEYWDPYRERRAALGNGVLLEAHYVWRVSCALWQLQ